MTSRAPPRTVPFLPSLPARGATDSRLCQFVRPRISPLAPREGSDLLEYIQQKIIKISTLAPREGSDPNCGALMSTRYVFLPSLPARGATGNLRDDFTYQRNFYPRSPRGERHREPPLVLPQIYFYPRSPRGERPRQACLDQIAYLFLPSLPARGATVWSNKLRTVYRYFYPRSPRGERPPETRPIAGIPNFYPRSPRGERLEGQAKGNNERKFLPSLPARGATTRSSSAVFIIVFLPSLPARGATTLKGLSHAETTFLPSLPARGATRPTAFLHRPTAISTLAPREGSDGCIQLSPDTPIISTLAPREGSDTTRSTTFCGMQYFYPRSPRGERQKRVNSALLISGFLPSLPARGATPPCARDGRISTFLPSLPARGATRQNHASAGGSLPFLPSLPARGATAIVPAYRFTVDISTLAPREGSDLAPTFGNEDIQAISTLAPREGSDPANLRASRKADHFYPRSPRGERRFP